MLSTMLKYHFEVTVTGYIIKGALYDKILPEKLKLDDVRTYNKSKPINFIVLNRVTVHFTDSRERRSD